MLRRDGKHVLAMKKVRLPTISVDNFVDNKLKLPSKPEEFEDPVTLSKFWPIQNVQ
jgi:hypothetical protein